ncbi:hypothetical protein [Zavarzinia sp. CC-PAN008]|uniref:hypothetical protein n=1 Tax=Zavarzinia sp. CC-PAN008 TaxID=3243332 RepID=UPI003F74394A
MTAHSYPLTELAADYARAAGGLAVCGGLLAVAQPAPFVAWALGAGAIVFAGFGLATLNRHLAPIAWDGQGVRRGGLRPASIAWHDLAGLRLRFFSTRRDRQTGWMDLVLSAPGARIVVAEGLPGFRDLVARAGAAARARGLDLSPATLANLGAMGLPGADAGAAGMAP